MTTLTTLTIKTKFDTQFPQWQPAKWEDYLSYRDNSTLDRVRLFFNNGQLFIEMGTEGINHASVSDLLTMLFIIWFMRKPEQKFKSYGRCLLEKPNKQAAAPDQVLYIGENAPQWQEGEPRRIDLDKWRVPNLVGEVSDTTLATDLDEKKQLYASLGIPEYWVTDIKGKQILAFQLQANGKYQQCEYSLAFEGLAIDVVEQTLQKLSQGDHTSAVLWFREQIANL